MTSIMQNTAGIANLNDQVIATDFLISSKAAVKNYSSAITETASSNVRDVLRRQLDVAIGTHERITNYMMNKGYYQAYNPQEQIKMDIQAADTVIGMQANV